MKDISEKSLLKDFTLKQSIESHDQAGFLYWTWKRLWFRSRVPKAALKLFQGYEVVPRDKIGPECDLHFTQFCEEAFTEMSPKRPYFPKDHCIDVSTWFFMDTALNGRGETDLMVDDSFLILSREHSCLSLLWKHADVVRKKLKMVNWQFFAELNNLQQDVKADTSALIGAWRYREEFAAARIKRATEGMQAAKAERKKAIMDAYKAAGFNQKKMTLHRAAVTLSDELKTKYHNIRELSLNTIKTILKDEGVICKR